MAQDRKRKIRLSISFAAALLLAAALVYVSFTASSQAKSPSEILAATAQPGASIELYGKVVDGSVTRENEQLSFVVADQDDPASSVPVRYSGTIPDPFREGREVIVTGELVDGVFVAKRDSLITKCPSKFEEEDPAQSAH